MSGSFLKAEGFDAHWSISPQGVSAIKALEDGSAHVIQSVLSQGFGPLSKEEAPPAMHFAQVNEMDGFFITAHEPDPAFTSDKLEGADAVLFGGGQPLAMFKYACTRPASPTARSMPLTLGALGKSPRQPIKRP
jgi:NitT/TauT family transport system substrate-binding protein